MTAAKMVLHDWQRGKIPFFVPPSRQDDPCEEPNVNGLGIDDAVDSDPASAAFKAIANVLSSQQQRSAPVQRDLYDKDDLRGESSHQLADSDDDISEENLIADCDTSEQILAAEDPSEQPVYAEA